MDEFRVSVVVPAYRCARIIGPTMTSLLAQTRLPDEIIVVDDGSPDDIASAVRPYGDRIRLLRKENGGAASARNAGLDVATGDIVAFQDSDDLWEPTKLQSQLEVFRQHPEVGLVASRYSIHLASGGGMILPDVTEVSYDQVLRLRGAGIFEVGTLIFTSTVALRKASLGADRFDVTLQIAEDRDLWVRLLTRMSCYLQSDPTAILIERAGSLSRSNLDMDCQCMLRVIQKNAGLLSRAGRRRWEAMVYRRWAGTYLGMGHAAQAAGLAWRRLRYQPWSPEAWWTLAKSSTYAMCGIKKVSPDCSYAPEAVEQL